MLWMLGISKCVDCLRSCAHPMEYNIEKMISIAIDPVYTTTYRKNKRIFARRVRSHSSGRRQLRPLVAACSTAAGGAAGEGVGESRASLRTHPETLLPLVF